MKTMRSCICHFLIALAVLGIPKRGFAQTTEPPLAAIKVAAERGNPGAQEKLGDFCSSSSDTVNALIWYRKAAEQGMAHSQGELGRFLINCASSSTATPAMRTKQADEAIAWLLKAANQGDAAAQFELGRQFEEGKFIKPDYVEAYKWYGLAAQGKDMTDPATLGASLARDALIVKLSRKEIVVGQKRVADFVPRRLAAGELPEPTWVKEIKLQGVSGVEAQRLAIINGRTFQKGERQKIKASAQPVEIHCLEVGQTSATITIEGISGQRELKLAVN